MSHSVHYLLHGQCNQEVSGVQTGKIWAKFCIQWKPNWLVCHSVYSDFDTSIRWCWLLIFCKLSWHYFLLLSLLSERVVCATRPHSRPSHVAFHWPISQYRSFFVNSLAVFLGLFSVTSDVELLEYLFPLSVSTLEKEMYAQKCEERLEQWAPSKVIT